MQNAAEFHIIGRVGKVDVSEKVTHVNIASNYNRLENGEWKKTTLWNRVTLFGKAAERMSAETGDLVRSVGRISQNTYERRCSRLDRRR